MEKRTLETTTFAENKKAKTSCSFLFFQRSFTKKTIIHCLQVVLYKA